MEDCKKVELINNYCLVNDLSSYDPYDIWKTKIGFFIKNGFNKSKYVFILPAAILTIFDLLINNKARLLYSKLDYPIVYAFNVLTLLKLNEKVSDSEETNTIIEKNLKWLSNNYCKGYNGYGWGINFKLPIDKNIVYKSNTPYATITPYVLEAFVKYKHTTKSDKFDNIILGVYDFLEIDLVKIIDNPNFIGTSYGPLKDRVVTNSVSYTMYSYALLIDFFPEKKNEIENKIRKLYHFICFHHQENGAWFYNPYDENSFIDCFHSAFVIKNLIKTSKLIELNNAELVIEKGFNYIQNNFRDSKTGLYKRFSVNNKPGFTKFDLYDNAEMLNLLVLLGKDDEAVILNQSIAKVFIQNTTIYSMIDRFNYKKNKNTLRWAVFPYLYSLSQTIK